MRKAQVREINEPKDSKETKSTIQDDGKEPQLQKKERRQGKSGGIESYTR